MSFFIFISVRLYKYTLFYINLLWSTEVWLLFCSINLCQQYLHLILNTWKIYKTFLWTVFKALFFWIVYVKFIAGYTLEYTVHYIHCMLPVKKRLIRQVPLSLLMVMAIATLQWKLKVFEDKWWVREDDRLPTNLFLLKDQYFVYISTMLYWFKSCL